MSTIEQGPSDPISDDLRLPRQEETKSSDCSNRVEKILKNAGVEDLVDYVAKQSAQEMHQDRMFVLREQTKFLNLTEWRYQPIDVLIGCLVPDSRMQ